MNLILIKNKSNLTNVRQFRRKKGAEICYIPIGDDQLYYDGYAYGYWQVKPATTKFVKVIIKYSMQILFSQMTITHLFESHWT